MLGLDTFSVRSSLSFIREDHILALDSSFSAWTLVCLQLGCWL